MSGEGEASKVNFWLGRLGTARKMPPPQERTEDQEASLVTWLITLDTDEPEKKLYYGLSLVHLRDLPSHKAKRLIPETGHELLLIPLEGTEQSNPDDASTWHALEPVAQLQIADLTDEQATLLSSAIASACVEGQLPIPKPGEFLKWGPYVQQLIQEQSQGQIEVKRIDLGSI